MKVKSLIIFVFLLLFVSFNVNAATIPASMKLSWKSGKESIVANVDTTTNGYKGINSVKEYKLFNSKEKMLYRYKTSSEIQQSRLYKDGTVYLLEGKNTGSGKITALNSSGKVKWRKDFSKYQDITLQVNSDGTIYFTGVNKDWYVVRLNPTSGQTIWTSYQQGIIGIGSNGNVLIPKGSYLDEFSYYHNGKLLWSGTTPEPNNQIESATISTNGNVAIVSKRGMMHYYVQLYNSSGNKLLTRKLIDNNEQIGQVIFNDKGDLLITGYNASGKLFNEWYSSTGKLMSKSNITMPKFLSTNHDYEEAYTERQFIVKADNNRNVYLRLTSDYIFKYNASGKLVGKTNAPYYPIFNVDETAGLIYQKYDKKTKSTNYYIYTFR